jgi:hypothetical protein
VLLEYYRREKKIKMFILSKLFMEYKEKQSKINREKHQHKSDPYNKGLSFASFRDIIEIFDSNSTHLSVA